MFLVCCCCFRDVITNGDHIYYVIYGTVSGYIYSESIYPSMMMHPRLQQHFGPQWRPNPCNHRFEGWNEALSHALDGLERQTTGQKCSTHRALSRCVVRFKLPSKKVDPQDSPSRPGRFRISSQFVCHRARVAATHEAKAARRF